MIKLLTWLVLVGVLISTLFKIGNAELSNNILGIALMILLLTLFSDLKEFNFWGLSGKKSAKDLQSLEGQQATSSEIKVDKKQLDEAEKNTQVQLMDTAQGNFIAVAFEVERLLRIFATVSLAKDVPANVNPVKLTKELHQKELLTESGIKQIEAIRWLRNMIIHGRQNEINQATLDAGIQLAYNLHQELYSRLYQ